MRPIRIVAAGQTWTFEESRPLSVGRAPENDVVLGAVGISRRHAELRPVSSGWELLDLGGENGTWIDEERVGRTILGPSTAVRFGGREGGLTATITVTSPDAAAPVQPQDGSSNLAATVIHSRPVMPGAASGDTRPGLLVRSRTGDARFTSAGPVRIGREPTHEIVADDPAVSRQHAVVEPRPDGWWFVDGSNSGSYIDGQQVKTKKIAEPTTVHLGHPTAGYELTLIPIVATGVAQRTLVRRRRRRALVVGAAVVAVVALVAGGITAAVVLSDDDNTTAEPAGLSSAELDRAKKASVQIIAANEDEEPLWRGSGSVISDTGLVLTNAHVADPNAPGSSTPGEDAAIYFVALPKGDDTPAEPSYRAKLLVSDGYLDLAVVQITENADGTPIDTSRMQLPEPIPIGDSKQLQTGDEITALGYPALTSSGTSGEGPLTITRGVVSSFQSDPVTDTPRFWIDSDLRLGSGNSGGASINDDGELVGVNSAVITATTAGDSLGDFTSGSSLIRPVEFATDVIRIAREGGDPDYQSPYLEKLPRLDPDADVTLESAGWSRDRGGRCEGSSTEAAPMTLDGVATGDTLTAEFRVDGVPDGTAYDIVVYTPGNSPTVIGRQSTTWERGSGMECVTVTLQVPEDVTGLVAEVGFGWQFEVSAVNPVLFR